MCVCGEGGFNICYLYFIPTTACEPFESYCSYMIYLKKKKKKILQQLVNLLNHVNNSMCPKNLWAEKHKAFPTLVPYSSLTSSFKTILLFKHSAKRVDFGLCFFVKISRFSPSPSPWHFRSRSPRRRSRSPRRRSRSRSRGRLGGGGSKKKHSIYTVCQI